MFYNYFSPKTIKKLVDNFRCNKFKFFMFENTKSDTNRLKYRSENT